MQVATWGFMKQGTRQAATTTPGRTNYEYGIVKNYVESSMTTQTLEPVD